MAAAVLFGSTGGRHVSNDVLQSQRSPDQPDLHLQIPQSQIARSAPPHRSP